MKLSIPHLFLIAVIATVSSPLNGFAQLVTFTSTTTTVIPAAPCDHIIQMLLRHGVNNQCDRTIASLLVNPSLSKCAPNALIESNDLQVSHATLIPKSEFSMGSRIAIAIVNRSSKEARDFHVSVAAIREQLHPNSPISTVRVERIGPGESLEVSVPLPQEIGTGNGPAMETRFERVIVAVDCFNRIPESDEANNIRMFDYRQLMPTATCIPNLISTQHVVPALALLENSSMRTDSNWNRDSYVTVDALDLDQPTPDSLRSAIQSVNPPLPAGPSSEVPAVVNPL